MQVQARPQQGGWPIGKELMTDIAEQTAKKVAGSRVGTVSSRSGEKTVSVVVDNLVKHERYGKFIRRRTKLAVHDADNVANAGDVVEIAPCRRLSKSKSWRLLRVVRRSVLEK